VIAETHTVDGLVSALVRFFAAKGTEELSTDSS
jgi:hypothetical protein